MDKSRTNSALLVEIQRSEQVPLHRQIATSIRDSIRSGQLPRGSSLPPSRVLAADLGVSRGVVVEAYQQLSAEGIWPAKPAGTRRWRLARPRRRQRCAWLGLSRREST
jgi:GntR family transcriptional regulator/MocR family aminotransferase